MKKQYFINANIVDPHNSMNENGGLIIGEDGLIEGIGKKVHPRFADVHCPPPDAKCFVPLEARGYNSEICLVMNCNGAARINACVSCEVAPGDLG